MTVRPMSTVWPEGRKSKAPTPLLPAHSRKMKDKLMCMSRPESCCRPMLEDATASSRPCFCRKRTLMAMPPTRAGTMRFTKEPPSCVANVAATWMRRGTAPRSPIVAPTYVSAEAPSAYSAHVQSASFSLDHTPLTSASCGMSR